MVLHGIAFPQGPSFPSLGHKQARVSQGMGGKETFVVIADLCIVLYIERCVRTSCYQLCEYKATNSKSELCMVQYHCGLWFLPCAVWPAHVQVHCAPPSQASHGSAVSWILPSFASSPSTAPWEQPGRGSVKFECILSLSSGEACAGKILDFLEEGLHYRRRRVLWLCSISTSEVDNYGWHNERGEKVWPMLHKRRIKPCWDNGVERSEEDKERTWTRGPISDEHISFAQIWPTQRQRVSGAPWEWEVPNHLAIEPKLELRLPTDSYVCVNASRPVYRSHS